MEHNSGKQGRPTSPFPESERFVVRSELGQGVLGCSYEAYDRERGEAVLVKVCHPGVGVDAHARLETLVHPGLAHQLGVLQIGRVSVLLSELLSGPDFVTAVKRTSRQREEVEPTEAEWSEVRAWVTDALEGLAYLEEQGVGHGSVTPANLLLDAVGRMRLTDYGLAEVRARSERPLGGEHGYLAPELQLTGRDSPGGVSVAADLYSLGVMLYEGLTGIRPGAGRDRRPGARKASVPEDLDELCRALLQPDPRERPDPTAALGLLATARGSSESRPWLELPFIGRQKELLALQDALDKVRSRKGGAAHGLIWLRGRSGVGKTHLVDRFLDLLNSARPNSIVLRSICHRQDSVPFEAFSGLVDSMTRQEPPRPASRKALAKVFPQLFEPSSRAAEAGLPGPSATMAKEDQQAADRGAAFEELRDTLGQLAAKAPLVLVLEDLQWGDADSAALFAEIVREPMPAYLVIASYRSEDFELSPFLNALPADVLGAGHELVLEEMSNGEASQLAHHVLRAFDRGDRDPDANEDLVRHVVDEGQGNPFLIKTLSMAAARSGTLDRSESGALSLRRLLGEQIEALSGVEGIVLEILALAEMPISVELARRATRLATSGERNPIDRSTFERAIAGLEREGLVRLSADQKRRSMQLSHDRVRNVVLARMTDAVRRKRHGQLARAMEGVEGSVDFGVVAEHLRRYRDDHRAAAYAIEAADQAMKQLAFERAARLYKLAVEMSHGEPASDLHVRFADALRLSGRAVEAAGEYLNAVRTGSVQRVGELQLRAAEQLLISGHTERGLRILKHVFRGLKLRFPLRGRKSLFPRWLWRPRDPVSFKRRGEHSLPQETLLRVDALWSGTVGLRTTDPIRAEALQGRHLRAAYRAGEPSRVARALAMEVFSSSLGGTRTVDQTRRLVDAATRLAEEQGDPESLGRAALAAVMAESGLGRWAPAVRLGRQAALHLEERCSGVAWERRTNQDLILQALNGLGAFREIMERVPCLLQEAREHDDRYAQNQLGIWQARTRLIENRPEKAREELEEIGSHEPGETYRLPRLNAELIECEVRLYQGDASVFDRLAELSHDIHVSNILSSQMVRIRLAILRARAAILRARGSMGSQLAMCLESARRDIYTARREGAQWGDDLCLVLEAALAEHVGDREGAIRRYGTVEERARDSGAKVLEQICRIRRAELVGGVAGEELEAAGLAALREEGVVLPTALCNLFAPRLAD